MELRGNALSRAATHNYRVAKDTHFSRHLHQKELLTYLSRTFLLHRDLSSGALNDGPGVDVCGKGSFLYLRFELQTVKGGLNGV